MKIRATDPDIFSICTRIERGIIDLKPEFQRGDVWNSSKKKLLIDSILREWQVPPVHVIRTEELKQEVLDGQQRLRAIYDFFKGEFAVNGHLEPLDDRISKLHGLKYRDLPEATKIKFDMYAVRVFEITEYNSGEPGELFNRLNNALNLTSAEKRNAYVGSVTHQGKELVTILNELGLDKSFLGFTNNRLAYDDMLIKICYMHEQKKGLDSNISDQAMAVRYKSDFKFSDDIVKSVQSALNLFADIKNYCVNNCMDVHVTKATAFSWLYFISEIIMSGMSSIDKDDIIRAFISLESTRYKYRNNLKITIKDYNINVEFKNIEPFFSIYNERASSKVMTASSLKIRDMIISFFFAFVENQKTSLPSYKKNIVEKFYNDLFENGWKDPILMLEKICGPVEDY